MKDQDPGERVVDIEEPSELDEEDFWDDDMPPEVPERTLRCGACGAEGSYSPEMLFNDAAREEPLYVGDDLTCGACGAHGPFTLSPEETARAYRERDALGPYGDFPGFPSPVRVITSAGELSPGRALAHAQRGVEAAPLSHLAWLELARVHALLGPCRRAREAYERAHALSPTDIEVRVDLALCLLELGEPARAHRLLERALRRRNRWTLSPGAPSPHDLSEIFWSVYDSAAREVGEPRLPYETFETLEPQLRRLRRAIH